MKVKQKFVLLPPPTLPVISIPEVTTINNLDYFSRPVLSSIIGTSYMYLK